ncbi:MAG: hypothetical protein ABI599_03710 [Flavobacteriales bacterium]
MTTTMMMAIAITSASLALVGCTKEEAQEGIQTVAGDTEGVTKAVGNNFINGLGGWDGFSVNTKAAELGEFEADINNTGLVTIRTEASGNIRVGDGGNYPAGVCDGPVPAQGGFKFKKGTIGVCGKTYFITPRNGGNDGQALKIKFEGGVLPTLPAGQSWFTVSANGTWSANALAGNYFCWSTQAHAPTSLCE